MADIIHGERLKKVLRMLLKLGYKTLKKDMAMVGYDLKHNQNPVIKNLNAVIVLTAENLHQKDNWQRNMVLGYGQAFLWTIVKDTAYRDSFFWALDKLLEHPEELRKMLKPYVKPPEEWIPNLWEQSKEKTRQLRKDGKISKDSQSFEESMYTHKSQIKRFKNILKNK